MQRPLWYQQFKNNPVTLCRSQRDGNRILREQLVPIRALISVASGEPAAGFDELWKLLEAKQERKCSVCGGTLTGPGDGHVEGCALYSFAIEVLAPNLEDAR